MITSFLVLKNSHPLNYNPLVFIQVQKHSNVPLHSELHEAAYLQLQEQETISNIRPAGQSMNMSDGSPGSIY